MNLRPTTNLLADNSLRLPRSELKSGFFYLYNRGYKGKPLPFVSKLWLSTLLPSIANNPKFGSNPKTLRKEVEYFHKNVPSSMTKIKKVIGSDPHFAISVPLASINTDIKSSLPRLAGDFLGSQEFSDEDLLQGSPLANVDGVRGPIAGSQVVANLQDANARAQLKDCITAMRFVPHEGRQVVFLDMKIAAKEAQHLTNTDWVSIRTVDIFPLILQWVESLYGTSGKAPLSSFPISRIAKTLPPIDSKFAKINEYGISIAPDGTPRYLPRELNNTQRYEDLYSLAGQQEDGSFALMNEDGVSNIKGLPSNVPVLIDWVNSKYSYTNTNGFLQVQDLSRYRKCTATHARNILNNNILDEDSLSSLASIANVDTTIRLTPEALKSLKDQYPNEDFPESLALKAYVIRLVGAEIAARREKHDEETSMAYSIKASWISLDGAPEFQVIAKLLPSIYEGVLNNLDAVYAKYSVSWVSTHFAMLALMVKEGNNAAALKIKDETIRGAALTQGIDPNFQIKDVALLKKNFGVLPHQKKVRNLMKGNPDVALLPVDAGGGKTPLIVLDILDEFQKKLSSRFLVLCPPHLVSQYTKEIAYFTEGKLNTIPVSTRIMRLNGVSRMTDIIANAPRNTVVICSYDALRVGGHSVCYGTTTVAQFPLIDILRQFDFDYVALDESHSVRNDSARTRATMSLISDIPKKRLASGTMNHESPSDMAVQFALLDPTVFGSRDRFNDRFGLTVNGSRVAEWKPNAQLEINRLIKERAVVAGAKRKEWAALLPEAIEKFYGVTLTPAQREVYDILFAETLDLLKEAAKSNKKLASFLNKTGKVVVPETEGDGEGEADIDDSDDEEGSLESLLNPYLSRLEQFTTAPSRDPLGDKMLQGSDRLSPKAAKVVEIIREHISENREGKVLVFTNYIETAEELFDVLPQDLKDQAILYVAAEKTEAGAEFENNPRKKIMIGVEHSMNTGLNLQFCSHLVRVEQAWNPGTVEQGNARINRPEMKTEDRRKYIWYSSVIADRTIDVTKQSRLIAKIINIAKFENAGDPLYDAIPEVPVMAMTLETVQENNSWEGTLQAYGLAFRELNKAIKEDYAQYREKFKSELTADGRVKLTPVGVAETPKDAKMLYDAPLIAGTEVYGSEQLGLIRVDEYFRLATTEAEEEGEAADLDDDTKSLVVDEKRMELARNLIGETLYTEWGQFPIQSISFKGNRVKVLIPPDKVAPPKMNTCFIATRLIPKGLTVKEALAKLAGMELTDPSKVRPLLWPSKTAGKIAQIQEEKQRIKEEKERKKRQDSMNCELQFTVTNGFLGITYFTDGTEVDNALQALGFRPNPDFLYAPITNHLRLKKQIDMWRDAGFTLGKESKDVMPAITDLYNILKAGKVRTHTLSYKFSTRNDLKNFYRTEFRPTADKALIRPYPLIEDGEAYLVLPLRGQPGTLAASRVRAPGVKWMKAPATMTFYGLNPPALSACIKNILSSGIQITNLDELRKEFKHIQKLQGRNTDE